MVSKIFIDSILAIYKNYISFSFTFTWVLKKINFILKFLTFIFWLLFRFHRTNLLTRKRIKFLHSIEWSWSCKLHSFFFSLIRLTVFRFENISNVFPEISWHSRRYRIHKFSQLELDLIKTPLYTRSYWHSIMNTRNYFTVLFRIISNCLFNSFQYSQR